MTEIRQNVKFKQPTSSNHNMTEQNITADCRSCQQEKNSKEFNKSKKICKACQKQKRRMYNLTEKAIKLDMLKHAKQRAAKNNLPFQISIEDIPPLPEYCPVFPWIKLERSLDKATNNSYTLDRLDNSKGYIKGNIKVISNRANSCKRDMTTEEIKALLEYTQKNQ